MNLQANKVHLRRDQENGVESYNGYHYGSVYIFPTFEKNRSMKFIVQILISALAVMVSQYVIPGVHVDDFFTGIGE